MNNPSLIKTFLAGAAIAKYRIVKFDSDDDTVIHAAAAGDALVGVAIQQGEADANAAESGDRLDIALSGVAEVEYGGTITRGDLITSDANGKAVVATPTPHVKQTVIDGGAAGDHTVTGITTDDTLISVIHVEGSGSALTGGADLTSEFTITAADTINNAGETATADGILIVTYLDASGIKRTLGVAMVSGVSGDIGSMRLAPGQV